MNTKKVLVGVFAFLVLISQGVSVAYAQMSESKLGGVVLCGAQINCNVVGGLPAGYRLAQNSTGNAALRVGQITGHIFYDKNKDGVQQAGESSARGIKVLVQGVTANIVETDASGNYTTLENEGKVILAVLHEQEHVKDALITTQKSGGNLIQEVMVMQNGTVQAHAIGLGDPGRLTLFNTLAAGQRDLLLAGFAVLIAALMYVARKYKTRLV